MANGTLPGTQKPLIILLHKGLKQGRLDVALPFSGFKEKRVPPVQKWFNALGFKRRQDSPRALQVDLASQFSSDSRRFRDSFEVLNGAGNKSFSVSVRLNQESMEFDFLEVRF